MTDIVEARYRGFILSITDRDVTVLDSRRRKLGQVPSVKAARLFIRGWCRAERLEAA